MMNAKKIIIFILIILVLSVIAYAGFLWWKNNSANTIPAGGIGGAEENPELTTPNSDASDNALDQDLQNIDKQISNFGADASSIDQSINDSQNLTSQ